MASEDYCQETTNYGYQPYNQLVKNLYSKNEKINELKLLTCNVNRTNVGLKNANSQLNKLISLISKEESPRIATFFRVCLKQKLGPATIVEALGALETIYNSIENKTPNMLPKVSTCPYHSTIADNFLLKPVTLTKLDKAKCKVCSKEVNFLYMRSHVAVQIIKGETTGQVCGSCGIVHTGNVQKILTKNKAFKADLRRKSFF